MIDYNQAVEIAFGARHDTRLVDIVARNMEAMHADFVDIGASPAWAWGMVLDACEAIAAQAGAEVAHRRAVGERLGDGGPEVAGHRVYRG